LKRRDFITLFGGATAAWPLTARAQQTGRVYRVALVFTTSPVSEMAGSDPIHPLARSFVQELRTLGYVQGQNLVLAPRSAEGKFERFPEIWRRGKLPMGVEKHAVRAGRLGRCDLGTRATS
jgi:putative ABC transport system substrate-binding protein